MQCLLMTRERLDSVNKSEGRQSVNRRSDEDEESDEDNYNKENLAKRSVFEVHSFVRIQVFFTSCSLSLSQKCFECMSTCTSECKMLRSG